MPDLAMLLMIVMGVLGAFAGAFILTWILRMQVVPPNQMMILSGFVPGGFRQIRGGRAYPLPLIHAKDVLSCEAMPVDIKVQGALSKGEIPLNVDAYANVCISAQPAIVKNAVRRILRKGEDEILHLAQKTLEGNLREAISSLTPEEVIRDKEEFGRRITEASRDDLGKLGLTISSFVVQTIADKELPDAAVGYIGLLERGEKARAKAEAIVATFSAKAEQIESAQRRRQEAELKRVENEREKVKRERDYQVNKMNAEGTVGVEKMRSDQRIELSRVQHRIKAREEEILMLTKKFEAELEKKAEADAKKLIEEAKASAAQILRSGNAEVDVLEQTFAHIHGAGGSGTANYLVDRMPEIARAMAATMRSAEVKTITVMEGSAEGGSGGGAGAGSLFDAGRLIALIEQVKTGSKVDLGALLRPSAPGATAVLTEPHAAGGDGPSHGGGGA
ncbi:MAG: hypothetical protein HZA54_18320 [Planctomycetes bacterium]|nr:hypothetical protein [Planctomycetota bacterium]